MEYKKLQKSNQLDQAFIIVLIKEFILILHCVYRIIINKNVFLIIIVDGVHPMKDVFQERIQDLVMDTLVKQDMSILVTQYWLII